MTRPRGCYSASLVPERSNKELGVVLVVWELNNRNRMMTNDQHILDLHVALSVLQVSSLFSVKSNSDNISKYRQKIPPWFLYLLRSQLRQSGLRSYPHHQQWYQRKKNIYIEIKLFILDPKGEVYCLQYNMWIAWFDLYTLDPCVFIWQRAITSTYMWRKSLKNLKPEKICRQHVNPFEKVKWYKMG